MTKYNYETNYEEAIKQGISKEEYSREASKNCIQTWIANELAEANRLKRLELSLKIYDDKYGHIGEGTGFWIIDHDKIKKELEDQA